jgi:hypothetical protein
MNNPKIKVIIKFEINPKYDIEGYKQLILTTPTDIRPSNLLSSNIDIVNLINLTYKNDIILIKKRVSDIEKNGELLNLDSTLFQWGYLIKRTYQILYTFVIQQFVPLSIEILWLIASHSHIL